MPIQNRDKLHAHTVRSEHRSKLPKWNRDKLHAKTQRIEHRRSC